MSKNLFWLMKGGDEPVITDMPELLAATDGAPELVTLDIKTTPTDTLPKLAMDAAKIATEQQQQADTAAIMGNTNVAAQAHEAALESMIQSEKIKLEALSRTTEHLKTRIEDSLSELAVGALIQEKPDELIGDAVAWEQFRPVHVFPAHDVKLKYKAFGSDPGAFFGNLGQELMKTLSLDSSVKAPMPAVSSLEKAKKVGDKICRYIKTKTGDAKEIQSTANPNLMTSDLLGSISLVGKFTEKPQITSVKDPVSSKDDYGKLLKESSDLIVYTVAWDKNVPRFLINDTSKIVVEAICLHLCDPSYSNPEVAEKKINEMAAKYTDDRLDSVGKNILMALVKKVNHTLTKDEVDAIVNADISSPIVASDLIALPALSVMAQSEPQVQAPVTATPAPTVLAPLAPAPQPEASQAVQPTPVAEIQLQPIEAGVSGAPVEQPAQTGGKHKKSLRDYKHKGNKYKRKYLKEKAARR